MKFVMTFISVLALSSAAGFADETERNDGRGCCSDHGGAECCNFDTKEVICGDGTISKECTCELFGAEVELEESEEQEVEETED